MYAVIKVAASCYLNSEYSSRAKWFQTRFSKWRMPKVLITLTGIPDYILLVRERRDCGGGQLHREIEKDTWLMETV